MNSAATAKTESSRSGLRRVRRDQMERESGDAERESGAVVRDGVGRFCGAWLDDWDLAERLGSVVIIFTTTTFC